MKAKSFTFCLIMGPEIGMFRDLTSRNHLYTAAFKSSYAAVRTPRALAGLLSTLALTSALFFRIVLGVLLGMLYAAATSDFFLRVQLLIISSFA